MFSVPSLVVTVLMTWAPFLVSNFPRIASVRAALDRRRLLTISPSCVLFCDLLPSLGTGARLKRIVRRRIKVFALDQKLGAPMSHGSDPKPRIHSRTFPDGRVTLAFASKAGMARATCCPATNPYRCSVAFHDVSGTDLSSALFTNSTESTADFRYGSKADMATTRRNVRFTRKSGHGSAMSALCHKRK